MGRIQHKSKSNKRGKSKEIAQVKPARIGKIPKGRKHKKIKASEPYDPDLVYKERDNGKKNAKPSKEDEDELPWSLKELLRRKELSKERNNKKKKKNKDKPIEMEHGMTREVKPIPEFKQRRNESELAFFHRIDREAHAVVAKSQMEDKYKVEIEEMQNGEVASKKKRKRNKNSKERLQKLVEKKKKKFDDVHDFKDLKDEVKFGEVVMAPPSLSSKPRKSDTVPKDKVNKGLLLTDILKNSSAKPALTKREVGQTTKRKHLSPFQQLQHDKERDIAIQRYRELKAKKMPAVPL